MALISCPECGRNNVSDSAESCPDCGFGIEQHFKKINDNQEKQRLEIEAEEKRQKLLVEEEKERQSQYQEKLNSLKMPDKPHLNAAFYIALLWSALWIFCMTVFISPRDGSETDGFGILISLFFLIIGLYFAWACIKGLIRKIELYKLSKTNFDEYKVEFISEQEKLAKKREDLSVQLEIQKQKQKERSGVPANLVCPICKSKNILPISTVDRMVSVGMVGLASNKINKQYECRDCKHKW